MDHSRGVMLGPIPPLESQGLDSTNNVTAHYEEGTIDSNHGEKSNLTYSLWPHVSEQKDKIRGNQSAGHASSYTHCPSKTFSDCYPGNPQHTTSSNMGPDAEGDEERTAAEKRETYSILNDPLATASTKTSPLQVQNLERSSSSSWTPVNQETLEISDCMGLEQDLSCKTPMAYEDRHSVTRGIEHERDQFGSVDDKWPNGHEEDKLEEMKRNHDSDCTKISPVGSNQIVQQMAMNSLTDDSALNEVLKRANSRTLEQYEPGSVCTSTSVNKLESLVNNIEKDIPSTPTLESAKLVQLQTHTNTNEPATECEASNLPQRQDVFLKMTSTCNTACPAVQILQKDEKKTLKPNKREVNDSYNHSKEFNDICSSQPPPSKTQECSTFQDSTVLEKLDLPANQVSEKLSTMKEIVPSTTTVFPPPDSVKNTQTISPSAIFQNALIIPKTARNRNALDSEVLHVQSQKTTCESRESTDDSFETNLESLSSLKEGPPVTDVSQCTRKKTQNKIKMQPDKEDCKILHTPCGQSIEGCGLPEASHLPKERSRNVTKSQMAIQKFANALADRKEKDEDQSRNKHQVPPETAGFVSEANAPKSTQSRRHKKKNTADIIPDTITSKSHKTLAVSSFAEIGVISALVSKHESAPLSMVRLLPTSDVLDVTNDKKAKSKRNSCVIDNMEEEKVLPFAGVKPSSSDSVSNNTILNSQCSIKKLKKRTKSKNILKDNDNSTKFVEHEQKNDCLKPTKAYTKKRKRSGHSFIKRKQRKRDKLFSVVLESSENTTSISQSDARDLVAMDVQSKVETEGSMDLSSKKSQSSKRNDLNVNTQTMVSSESCKKSPEHGHTVLTHSVATVDTVGTGTLAKDDVKSVQKKLPGKTVKKQEKAKGTGASTRGEALPNKSGKQQKCRKSVSTGGLEQNDSISKPKGLHTHAGKKRKKSKLQLRNVHCIKSRRISKFSLGSVKRLRRLDRAAAGDTISSNSQPASSQAVQENSLIKPRKLKQDNKAKIRTKKSNTPLSKNSCDVTSSSNLTAAQEAKYKNTSVDSSSVHRTLRSQQLKTSKESDAQVATCISPRRRKPNHNGITWNQALVTDAEPMENSSSAVTMDLAEVPEGKSNQNDQMMQDLKQTPLEISGVNFKSKRKASEQSTGPVSKRKVSSRQQTMSLEQELSKTDQFLDCLQGPLKTELPEEKNVKINPSKDTCVHNSDVITKTEVEEVQFALSTNTSPKESKFRDVKERECEAPLGKKERKTAFELALESFIMTTQFYSSEEEREEDVICDLKFKEERSEKPVMESIEAVKERSSSLWNSENQKANPFTQDCNVDYIATPIKGRVDDYVKNKKVKSLLVKDSAKKLIVCKYCGQYFRHISAYTNHQRIHTGEKPYRCKLCGKNFAQLSQLKSHHRIHTQAVTLCCPCCSKTFSNKNSLVAHFKIHFQESENNYRLSRDIQCKLSKTSHDASDLGKTQQDRSLVCKICNKNFSNGSMLKKHVHGELSCKTCGKKFDKPSHLQVQERKHWPVKPYTCSISAKGFSRLKAMRKHSLEHAGETQFSCSHCSHAFCDLAALRVHQVSNQCRGKGELNGDSHNLEGFLVSHRVDGQVNTPLFFKCRICRQLFQKWCQYTLHLQTHTKFPPHLCFACGQSYDTASEVSIHCTVCCRSSGEEASCGASLSEIFDPNYSSSQNRICPSPYSLQTCRDKSIPLSDGGKSNENSQTSPSNSSPSAINPLHSAPPSPTPSVITCVSSNDSLECTEISQSLWRFQCPRCGRRFKRYRNLCTHMQTHAPGFRHVCGHCGQTFKRWNRLWLHQRIHGGKGRCYSCSQCSLQFRFFGSFKDHKLNHAGERPFACPLCPETFVCEESLHAHQCEFHKPLKILQCEICAKTFSNLRSLLKHSRLHNGAVSHQCLSCELCFTNNKILQEHLKTHRNSFGLPLPDIPSEPLEFPHKCKRCEARFSSGDLLYAHQACHFRSQAFSIHISEPPSCTLREESRTETPPLASTNRPLVSSLNIDAIPNDKSLYTYPHPDKLYTMPSLSRRIRLQIINLESDDNEENPPPASTASGQILHEISTPVSGRSLQRTQGSTLTASETDITHLPQGLESPEYTPVQSQPDDLVPADCTVTTDVEDNSLHNSVAQTSPFVETDVLLEDPTTFATSKDCEELDECFKCPDCSYKTSSVLGLHEHYFLRALADGCLPP